MQLTPRYGPDPLIVIDGDPASVAAPAIAQRRRLLDVVSGFSASQWDHASRCEGWSNRDVIVHLDSTNMFWTFSITAGVNGEPTQFLSTFDPVASPAELVAAAADRSTPEVLESFRASTEALVALWESLEPAQWSATAEAPPGHLRVAEVAHHAIWDSWVHERDVLEPLGLAQELRDDEVAACLRYAAALGPAFAVNDGSAKDGCLELSATNPDLSFAVKISDRVEVRSAHGGCDAVLRGDAAELVDGLSIRRPFAEPLGDDVSWMLAGLVTAFDGESAS